MTDKQASGERQTWRDRASDLAGEIAEWNLLTYSETASAKELAKLRDEGVIWDDFTAALDEGVATILALEADRDKLQRELAVATGEHRYNVLAGEIANQRGENRELKTQLVALEADRDALRRELEATKEQLRLAHADWQAAMEKHL